MVVGFYALEHLLDGTFAPGRFRFEGDPATGWQVERNGQPHLSLGPGYSLLPVRACGVCATDLSRRFLPFPLPQVIGHEVLVEDEAGERFVVEINASCKARGQALCPRCRAGLDHHCPERRVLGIHDLPGGFGPFLLAPVHATLPVPAALPDETAVLVEPFAAALHGVRSVALRDGDRVAVLGPRRLGMLVVAALAAERRRTGQAFELVAVVRRAALGELAREFGADAAHVLPVDGPLPDDFADVVFDTTGTPDGLVAALPAARRELHLKSTHGQPAAGLGHLTEAVVDELRFVPWGNEPSTGEPIWWAVDATPEVSSPVMGAAAALLDQLGAGGVVGAVIGTAAQADAAIRPAPGREESLVRPRGVLHVHPAAANSDALLLQHVARRGLVVSSSRCGDFRDALSLLAADPNLQALGPRLVTHRFGPDALSEAFEAASSPDAVKVLIEHPRS